MSWTESLFQKAEKWIHQMDQRRRGVLPSESAVRFEEIQSILNCWCLLISGRSWILQEAETWPAVDPERLYFPPLLEIFSSRSLNRKAYLYIACMMLGSDEIRFPELRRWRQEFQTAVPAEGEAPGLQWLHQPESLCPLHEIASWSPDSFRSLLNLWIIRKLDPVRNSRREEEGDGKRVSTPRQTEKKKKAREQVEILDPLGDPESENPLVHSFERLHTTDDYRGGHKKQDGEDELEEHQQSLEDLDLRQVIRSTQATQATLKGDFVMDLEVAESAATALCASGRTFFYDEWNEGKSSYHPRWCRLQERVSSAALGPREGFDPAGIRKRKRREIEQLTRCFYSLFQSSRWKSRQAEGSELDLDALVDWMSTPLEKRDEKMKVYLKRQKEINELAVVLLFDRSLSSDSWIDNRRVLDVTRESLVVIGETLKRFPLPVQLACFSSNTRNHVSYDVLKDFEDSWGKAIETLGGVDPSGYTRMGPALRHATYCLRQRPAKHKWILLLSDAKPTDFDKYEGRHGVRDVRKAVQESHRENVGVRCLSLEKNNRFELGEMFGPKGYELLSHADQLPVRLGALLKSLAQMAT